MSSEFEFGHVSAACEAAGGGVYRKYGLLWSMPEQSRGAFHSQCSDTVLPSNTAKLSLFLFPSLHSATCPSTFARNAIKLQAAICPECKANRKNQLRQRRQSSAQFDFLCSLTRHDVLIVEVWQLYISWTFYCSCSSSLLGN